MKLVKDMMFIGLGMTAVLAYQKYNQPIKNKIGKVASKMMNKTEDTIEDMI